MLAPSASKPERERDQRVHERAHADAAPAPSSAQRELDARTRRPRAA